MGGAGFTEVGWRWHLIVKGALVKGGDSFMHGPVEWYAIVHIGRKEPQATAGS